VIGDGPGGDDGDLVLGGFAPEKQADAQCLGHGAPPSFGREWCPGPRGLSTGRLPRPGAPVFGFANLTLRSCSIRMDPLYLQRLGRNTVTP